MMRVTYTKYSYAQKAIAVALLFALAKIICSSFIELGNDESYYWTFSKKLQINYFDHPPMVALVIKFFTANLLLEDSIFFLRLGSFVSGLAASFFIYKTIQTISNERAAFAGVVLLNASLYTSISAALFIIPDTPQLFFWTMSLYMLAQISINNNAWKPWIIFGITSGLCIMSKVHGVFLWSGIFLYALFYNRSLFKIKQVYVAAVITALIISPIFIWNIQNDFITYRFHSERVTLNETSSFNLMGLLREIIGQLVINNPVNIILIIFFVGVHFYKTNTGALSIFKLIGLPLLFIIFFIAIFRSSLPHWSGPAYVSLLPFAAIGLSGVSSIKKYKALLFAACFYCFVGMGVIICLVNYYPGTFSNNNSIAWGKNDISLDAYGWKEGGEKFGAFYTSQHNGANKPPLVCNSWWGGHDEYYFARPVQAKMIGLAPVLNIHQYAWRLATDTLNTNMDTAYTIIHSYDYYDPKIAFTKYYSTIDSVKTIPIVRGGKLAYNFYIWRLSGWKKTF